MRKKVQKEMKNKNKNCWNNQLLQHLHLKKNMARSHMTNSDYV